MHEHAAIESIVKAILKDPALNDSLEIKKVYLKIGALEFHSEAAFRQGFEVAIQGTPLQGAALELEVIVPQLNCPACGFQGACRDGEIDPHEHLPVRECPKCHTLARVTGGRGVQGIELSVES